MRGRVPLARLLHIPLIFGIPIFVRCGFSAMQWAALSNTVFLSRIDGFFDKFLAEKIEYRSRSFIGRIHYIYLKASQMIGCIGVDLGKFQNVERDS
jgi:hypothetical protein